MGTDFDISAWEAGQNNHAQGEDFDINKWEGTPAAPAASTPPAPEQPGYDLLFGKSGVQGVAGQVGSKILENVKALPAALNPVPQTKTETGLALAGLPAPVTRMVGGMLSALGGITQVPGAIQDINASPDPGAHYQQAAADTAGDALTLAALDKAGEVGGRVVENPPSLADMKAGAQSAAGVTKAVVKGGAKALDVTSFDRLGKLYRVGKETIRDVRDAVGEKAPQGSPEGTPPSTAPKTNTAPSASSQVTTDPEAIQARLRDILGKQKAEPKGKAPAVDAEAMKDRLASLENPTDADTLRSRLDELKNPQLTAQEMRDRLDEITNVHDAETLKARATPPGEAGYVHQAVQQAGPDATIKDVTAKAQELKAQGDQFQETFGEPLSDFRTPKGDFDMSKFLHRVVRPGVEPPAYVISRVFGSDGVKLVQDITGKPIEKWQSVAPEGEAKGGTARLRAKMAPSLKPEDAAEFAGRVNNVTPMGGAPMKELQQFAAKHATKLSHLASGGEATVFDLGNGKVMRVASGPAPKIPALDEVLQPLDQKTVKGATSDYHATVSPKVDTSGITAADVKEMTKRLADKGYQWDAEPHNLGRVNGKLVVVDPGGLDKIH